MIELICMSCKKTICSECVLFGLHKNHEYIWSEIFKLQAKNQVLELKKQVDEFKNPPNHW